MMEKRTFSLRRRTPRRGCRSRCRPASCWAPAYHPPHRLPQEVGSVAALPQPGHQHVAGAGGDGQQRVIAPLASCGGGHPPWPARRSADGGVQSMSAARLRRQRPRLGPATTRKSCLTCPHRKLSTYDPQSLPSRKRGVDGALTMRTPAVRRRRCSRPRPGRRPPGYQLVAGVRPARGIAQVEALLDQWKAPNAGPGCCWPPGGRRRRSDARGLVASIAGRFSFQNHYPSTREHLLTASGR